MEKEIFLAETSRAPSDVTLAASPDGGYVVAYSADGSTYTVRLSAEKVGASHLIPGPYGAGVPTGDKKAFWPSSVRPSIEAEDLDLVALPSNQLLLAALEVPFEGSPGGAFATLLKGDGTPEKTVFLGPSGEYATEISAVPWNDAVLIAWHDGTLSASRIHLVLLVPSSMTVEKHVEFQGKGPTAGPTLAAQGERAFIAWSETGLPGADPKSVVNTAWISRDLTLGRTTTVAEGRFIFPSPALISASEGLALIYRDDADKDDTPEFYYLALDSTGARSAEKKRISQADGFKGPSLEAVGDLFVSAAIRSFQRNLLIGLNRFDRQGVKQNGEFQVYADKTDFIRVDITRGKVGLMMVYAEDKRSSGRVLAGAVYCGKR